jgi:glycosyltransferase involved in cell wall biosynthesis
MEGALSVSVVVNNYNYERFVCQAVDSALDQTYARVEVVVVDDGSTDDSLELLRGYGDRITLLHQSNGGQAAALNAGFGAASGDLILFLDADDRLYPDAVTRVVEAFQTGDAKVQFRLDLVDRLGRSVGEVHPASGRVMPSGDVLPVLLRVGRYATSMTSGNAFPRKVLDAILPIPADSFRISADGYLVALAPFYGAVRSIDEALGAYRLHLENHWSMSEVDDARIRAFIEHDFDRYDIIRAAAADRNLPYSAQLGYDDPYHVTLRIASLGLNPTAHPVGSDTRWSLAVQGVRLMVRDRSADLSRRVLFSGWFIAMAAMPSWFLRPLVELVLVPQKRRRWRHTSMRRETWMVRQRPLPHRLVTRAKEAAQEAYHDVVNRTAPGTRSRCVEYLGWTGYDNMGDEALYIAHQEALSGWDLRLMPRSDLARPLAAFRSSQTVLRAGMLGGGTLIGREKFRLQLDRARSIAPTVPFYTLGTGVEDPEFYGASAVGQWRELRRWAETLGSLDSVFVRGQESVELLESIGVPATMVGDTAILLADAAPSTDVQERLVGINIGSAVQIWGNDQQRVVDEVLLFAKRLINRGWSIQMIPVSPRDVVMCTYVARVLGSKAAVFEDYLDLDDLLAAIRRCHVMVGQKLHSVVFASDTYVPSLALEYHPKCREFQLSIGRGDYIVRTDQVRSRQLADMVEDLADRRDWHQQQLIEGVGRLRDSLNESARWIGRDITRHWPDLAADA